MSYTATTDTIAHVVELVAQVRPTWDQGLTRVVLLSHAGQVDGNDLAIAALRYASTEHAVGPKGIGWRGPHWDGLSTKPVESTDQQWCQVCGKKGEGRCRGERLTKDDDHDFEPGERVRTRR